MKLRRHEVWRAQYRDNRYLSHLSEDELYERCSHLMSNLLTLESNGKIGMLSMESQRAVALTIKFTHVLEELGLAGKGLVKGLLDEVAIPSPSLHFAEQFLELKSRFDFDNEYLYKFGKSEFLSKYSFKVALASTYEKYENVSIQDSELSREFMPHPSNLSIHGPDGKVIDGVKNVKINFSTNWDYYIFCTSCRLDFRLFNDFDADCVLVIKDRNAFSTALGNKVNRITPLEMMEYGLVKYFDPVKDEEKGEPNVQFSKHFKYNYQGEHRHALVPRYQQSLKREIFIDLPEVAEYCELISLR